MIHCPDCLNYKTRTVTQHDDEWANASPIHDAIEEKGEAKIYYCKQMLRGRSTLRVSKDMKDCRSFKTMDGDV